MHELWPAFGYASGVTNVTSGGAALREDLRFSPRLRWCLAFRGADLRRGNLLLLADAHATWDERSRLISSPASYIHSDLASQDIVCGFLGLKASC